MDYNGNRYALFAIAWHQGEASGGHYWCSSRSIATAQSGFEAGDYERGPWRKANDATKAVVPLTLIKRFIRSKGLCSPYLLWYIRVQSTTSTVPVVFMPEATGSTNEDQEDVLDLSLPVLTGKDH